MDISIIIVNYNTPELLRDCVLSIKQSKVKANYEMVVVDNGSKKDSIETIKGLRKKELVDKAVFNEDNLGFSKANNLGIRSSQGKYKLLLNSDTIVKKNSVDSLLRFAKNTPDAGVVGAKLLNEDGSIQESCFNFPTIIRAIKQYWIGISSEMDKFAPQVSEPLNVDAVVGAAFLITPNALAKVGLLDERYFMFYEDLDYCQRVWRSGLKVYYLPDSKVMHLHGQSGKKIKTQKDQWRRLIPSSKIYHGLFKHYILQFILWTGQKLHK